MPRYDIQVKHVQGRSKSDRTVQIEIPFPSVWSIKDEPETALAFLQQLDDAFFKSKARRVILEHGPLQQITPEAALVLIAELSRVTKYAPHVKLQAKFEGTNPEVLSLLKEIGYFRYFRIDTSNIPNSDRLFITHRTGVLTVAEVAVELVSTFLTRGHLTLARCKRLVKGLIECMQNVVHHAYKGFSGRKLINRWWMCGYVDERTQELYFAFYDQGVGMPSTLRFKVRDRFPSPLLISRSDEELIIAAFHGQFSSTRLKNRGLGLPRLKKLVDEAPEGELFVQSKHSRVVLRPRTAAVSSVTQNSLEGTLLVWQILVDQTDGGSQHS